MVEVGIALIVAGLLMAGGTWAFEVLRSRPRRAEFGSERAVVVDPEGLGGNADPLDLEVVAWPREVGAEGDPLDLETRLDMVDRLALVGRPWCAQTLGMAAHEERDLRMLAAITAALRTF